jgi:hypothetical protein
MLFKPHAENNPENFIYPQCASSSDKITLQIDLVYEGGAFASSEHKDYAPISRLGPGLLEVRLDVSHIAHPTKSIKATVFLRDRLSEGYVVIYVGFSMNVSRLENFRLGRRD